MKTADEIWRDLEGFTPPNCPQCGYRATLDCDGYWCERCSDIETPCAAVDDIPNGAEFDELLAAYHAARGRAA